MNTLSVMPFKHGKARDPHNLLSDIFFKGAGETCSNPQIYQRGDRLYGHHDVADCLYLLVSGSAKSFILSETGEEHITHFVMPGDIIGYEGFDTHQHAYIVSFLETSSVISIPMASLSRELARNGELSVSLMKLMSHSVRKAHQMQLMLSTLDSEQRLVSFLLETSERFEEMGFSGRIFNLSMTRIDISKYLGMTIETVSRLFKRLQQRGLIEVSRRQIRICDQTGLRKILCTEEGLVLCNTSGLSSLREEPLIRDSA